MAIDLKRTYPRGPREQLDGIKLLPRTIDKARAQLAGTLGDYIYFGCGLNKVLFDTLDVTAEQFLDVVRAAGTTFTPKQDREALGDLRESPQDPGVTSDEHFLEFAKKSEVDNAVVAWIRNRPVPRRRIAEMNDRVERLAPQTPEERSAFQRELRYSASGRLDIRTFPDLLDYQEGRSP